MNNEAGKEILDTDTFTFNTAFANSQSKIKILAISSSNTTKNSTETEFQRMETLAKIEESRKHHLEACIVRIMKMRKKLDHTLLVVEVIQVFFSEFN